MRKDTTTPCFGCTKRQAGCHAKCPDYLDWDNNHKTFLEEKRRAYETDRQLTDTEIKRYIKTKYTKKNKRRFGR